MSTQGTCQPMKPSQWWPSGVPGTRAPSRTGRGSAQGCAYYWSVDFKECHEPDQAVPKHWEWQEGNFIRFCDLVTGKKRQMAFIGDSLQDQMVADLVRR